MAENMVAPILILGALVIIGIVATVFFVFSPAKEDGNVLHPVCDYNSPGKTYLKTTPNCVVNYLCINGEKAFHDSCGCGCEQLGIGPP